ncbi:uncharacterized protein LOC142575687 isoform X2 [Dermacentor variabilis]
MTTFEHEVVLRGLPRASSRASSPTMERVVVLHQISSPHRVDVSRADNRSATLHVIDEKVASDAMANVATFGHSEKPVQSDLASLKIRVDLDHKTTRQHDGTEKEETLITATYRGITDELARKLVNYFVQGL